MAYSDIQVQVALPMRQLDFLNLEHGQDIAYDMLEELLSLSEKLEFAVFDGVSCSPSIRLLEESEVKAHLDLWDRPDLIETSYEVIEFACSLPQVSYKVEIVDKHAPSERTSEAPWHDRSMIPELIKKICDLFVCCNLSRAASIQCADSLSFSDGRYEKYSTIPRMNTFFLQVAVTLANEINWPKLHQIELTKAWKWANRNEGFSTGFGGGTTGRALNAFSRLFSTDSDDAAQQLMWALIGVEAIYGNGRLPVMEQIKEKTQILLGKQSDFKKKIGEMYDFRSRFMHGDIDIPSLSFLRDGQDSQDIFERYTKKQIDTIGMASAILIATLQEMILRDWSGLEFSYAVNNKE